MPKRVNIPKGFVQNLKWITHYTVGETTYKIIGGHLNGKLKFFALGPDGKIVAESSNPNDFYERLDS